MSVDEPSKRQRERDDSEEVRFHQALGFEVSREELQRLCEDAPDARAQVAAATVLERADAGTLDQMQLDPEALQILREAVETGGEPTREDLEEGEDQIELPSPAMLMMGPVTEATGQRIAYALEVLASAARPDIFETEEAQQDDLGARLSEFGIEAKWPEGKTFAEAAAAGEVEFGGSGVGGTF